MRRPVSPMQSEKGRVQNAFNTQTVLGVNRTQSAAEMLRARGPEGRPAVKKRSTGNGTEGRKAWTVGMDLGDLHATLLSMMAEVGELEERSRQVDKQLKALARAVPLVERLETIPGVGLLNATAFSAMVGNFPRFKSGRRFASSLGLTPKESSSGKRRWLGSISKAGDPYLRTLLIGGARSMLLSAHRTKRPHRLQERALEVEKRRGRNRAAVAVANKLARIIWAVSTRGEPFKARFDIQNAPTTVPA